MEIYFTERHHYSGEAAPRWGVSQSREASTQAAPERNPPPWLTIRDSPGVAAVKHIERHTNEVGIGKRSASGRCFGVSFPARTAVKRRLGFGQRR
jgi:hypothetical protein